MIDVNILTRAVLDRRVRGILEAHAHNVAFYIPETAYAEAEEALAKLMAKHRGDPRKALAFLKPIAALGLWLGWTFTANSKPKRKGAGACDPEDWPILASALALGCPIWTEDTDFFGCGVATRTTSSIDSFLTQ